jgi:hypothetical protein
MQLEYHSFRAIDFLDSVIRPVEPRSDFGRKGIKARQIGWRMSEVVKFAGHDCPLVRRHGFWTKLWGRTTPAAPARPHAMKNEAAAPSHSRASDRLQVCFSIEVLLRQARWQISLISTPLGEILSNPFSAILEFAK